MKDQQAEQITNKIMIEFSKTIELFDLTPLEARVFSCLYLKGKPLTLDDMSEYLGNSKTAMSNSVRTLLDLNLVKRVWRKGERKNLYEAHQQLFKSFMTSYVQKWDEAINHQKHALLSIDQLVTKINKEQHDHNERLNTFDLRLKKIIDFHNLINQSFKKLI